MIRWPRGKGTSNSLKYSRKTGLVKPSISRKIRQDKEMTLCMGCAFGKEDLLKPSKTKVQGKLYEIN
jgi:hypothetical protein